VDIPAMVAGMEEMPLATVEAVLEVIVGTVALAPFLVQGELALVVVEVAVVELVYLFVVALAFLERLTLEAVALVFLV
jgi:hypothetical protein